MKENEIKAVDLVRRIRDELATELADQTPMQIMEFFNRAREKRSLHFGAKAPRGTPDRELG